MIRQKIRWLLIRFANWIDQKKGYYDLREPIVSLIQFKGKLIVATDKSMYWFKENRMKKIIIEKIEKGRSK